jgi:hypothetical protein
MNIEQIRNRAADCQSVIRCAELVMPGIRAQTVVIVGIGVKYVRIMFGDGSTRFVIPGRPIFFTCVW